MRVRWLVLLALVAWFVVAGTTVRGVGLVGEVAAAWALPTPPVVLTHLDAAAAPVHGVGPLELRPTRPMASVGGWPIAVNTYTGGLADWPARAVVAGTGNWHAGVWTNVALGGLLLLLVARFLRFHGTESASTAVAWLLATDWSFVFYRKVLAGTETLLLAAGLLVIWSLWSRRWKGGVHGTVAIALGVGLGLHAKLTFAASLVAWGITALAMRWDRAALRAPRPVARWVLVALPLVCVLPLLVTNLLLPGLGEDATRSHDTVALQIDRLSQLSPARESWYNLLCFFGDPNAWFNPALGASPVPAFSLLRLLGFVVTVAGAALEWRARTPTASAALLRFLSVAVPAQVALLFAANHDLHHLAQATPPLLLLVALGADRVAAEWAPPRSFLRTALTLLFVSPHLVAGLLHLSRTDAVLATLPGSTFTEAGQTALVDALTDVGCAHLVTSDYEVYGMIEARAPTLPTVHTWGAMANGERDARALLRRAEGGCYLVLRPTAPMIYNWRPAPPVLAEAAAAEGLRVNRARVLSDERGDWATIWTVSAY